MDYQAIQKQSLRSEFIIARGLPEEVIIGTDFINRDLLEIMNSIENKVSQWSISYRHTSVYTKPRG